MRKQRHVGTICTPSAQGLSERVLRKTHLKGKATAATELPLLSREHPALVSGEQCAGMTEA